MSNKFDKELESELTEFRESLTNKTPDEKQIKLIEYVREAAKVFGDSIVLNCPNGRNKNLAKTALEESIHRAVKSIILNK